MKRTVLALPLFLAIVGLVYAQTPPELKGHTGLVYSVAFSPDGRHLAYPVTGESTSEVSVVENILPALGSRK